MYYIATFSKTKKTKANISSQLTLTLHGGKMKEEVKLPEIYYIISALNNFKIKIKIIKFTIINTVNTYF